MLSWVVVIAVAIVEECCVDVVLFSESEPVGSRRHF
jgi:hypothetical protein